VKTKLERFYRSIVALLGGLLLVAAALQGQTSPYVQDWHGVDLKGIDSSANPCEDLYQFANGNWLKNNPIPPDRSSWGAGSEIFESNLEILRQILEAASKDTTTPAGSPTRKVGDFYRSGMDTTRIESEGARPLAPEFARIAAIKDIPDLVDELARLHRENISPVFSFWAGQDAKNSERTIAQLYQGGLGLPDRDYYLSDDAKMKEIRGEYVAHMAKMFELLGDTPNVALAEARTVMGLETQLAKASMTQVEQRDPKAIYNLMPVERLDMLTPGFSWRSYFAGLGLDKPGDINVAQPEFFKEIGRILTSVPLDIWQTYLRWHLINATAGRLSAAFVYENFHFNGTVLWGQQEQRPRWKRVLATTDNQLGEALGQLYVAKLFSPETKERARTVATNVIAALRDRLAVLDWISEATRQQALKKLDAIVVKVGYPDKWRDYSGLSINRGSWVLNVAQADSFEFQRNLRKIGKPVDRTEWGMTPPTINAYYDASNNEMVFPAGILQPPFFDINADDATNYGEIGATFGHELTHGFDDEGRQFDAAGNMRDWWTPADVKAFNQRATVVKRQFDAFVAVDTLHINGELTLGENLADLGGLRIAYLAFQKSLQGKPQPPKIDGFTAEQRFFLAYAQGWRQNTRLETLRMMVATDPHSPAPFRVNGPVANLPEFFEAFGCKAGDPLRRPDSLQAKIW
jgi:putative endopeptidase